MRRLWRTFVNAVVSVLCAGALALNSGAALAADPGITPTEVTIGGTHPFSGPASAYGVIGKAIGAYFSYINANGGVNGRKIKWIDLDDGYSPPQAMQLAHQLVEQEKVFVMFDTLGTAVNTAIRPYLNQNKIPHLFVASGATTWGRDASKFPFTIGWQPDYQAESIIYAQDILKNHPTAKIGVLYQNDDYGQDYLDGLNKGLGDKKSLIVKTASYEVTEPSVTSQVASLKAAGADTFFIFATPKFSSLALVAAAQQSWHPTTYLNVVSATGPVMAAAVKGAGPDAVKNVTSSIYLKDPLDPRYVNDPSMKLYKDVMAKYLPGADTADGLYVFGMGVAYTLVDCLKRAGKDPTRDKMVDCATHLDEADNPFVYPGIVLRTSPDFRFPITQTALAHWDGKRFVAAGGLIDARQLTMKAEH